MDLVGPSTQDWKLARRIYKEFSAKPHSQHIATAFALAHLSASVRAVRPTNVLELGAGIGTITKLLLEHDMRPQQIIATEDHPICLEALDQNLADLDRSSLKLVTTLDDLLELDFNYELAICDGGFSDPRQYKGVAENAVCFFEGSRGPHRRILQSYLEQRGFAFDVQNYNQFGYRIFLKQRRSPAKLLKRKLKIKRRKGCWIGTVLPTTA